MTGGYARFALYYLPDDPALAAFGAAWLGWDAALGREVRGDHGAARDQITERPRKYGFHGTLKPPFRLADGKSFDGLRADVAALAADLRSVRLDGLRLSALGSFLALVPEGDAAALSALAFRLVRELDAYRAPPTEAELARRREAGLTARQETLLARWGYPFVHDEFRFHMTLSGRLEDAALERVRAQIAARLPALPRPFEIRSVALLGEGADGRFRMIERFALTGAR